MRPQHILREQGQSLVVVALMLVTLFGFLALAIDVGGVYVQRRFAQNAADAGALAGARALALDEDAETAAREYAETRNSGGTAEVSVISPKVVVTVTKVCRTYFASLIGMPEFTVRAVAEARMSAPSSWSGDNMVPVAVHEDAINYEGLTLIWDSDSSDDYPRNPDDLPPGWNHEKDRIVHGAHRGWLDLDDEGSLSNSDLKGWIQFGYHGEPIRVGDWIQGDPGSRSSALQAMNDYRKVPGEIVICPVYDEFNGNEYHITSFAAFQVTAVNWKGAFKYILGYFLYYVAEGDQQGGGSLDVGVRVIDLVE